MIPFYAPVGELHERRPGLPYPPGWGNASPYAVLYRRNTPLEAYHTGIDYNKNTPRFDADAHSPVWSCSGTEKYPSLVTYAKWFSPNWGWLVIARHYVTPTAFVYARYAHLEEVQVQAGSLIYWNTRIGSVGRINASSPYHCHFDISPTDVLFKSPGDWPKLNRKYLLFHYLDPEKFIREHGGEFMAEKMTVAADAVQGLYANPARPFIPKGGEVMGYEQQIIGEQTWRRIQLLDLEDDGWMLEKDRNGVYLVSSEPGEPHEVAVLKLNIRRGAGTNNTIVRSALKGEVFKVAGHYAGAGAREWARITEGPMAGNYLARVDSVGTICLIPKS